MDNTLREKANRIIEASINAVLPDKAVIRALSNRELSGNIYLVAVGKAAWQMAKTAYDYLGERINRGIVITKYKHVKGKIGNFTCLEAGHPVPDNNSFVATQKVIDLVANLNANDTVLFLLSGGGSALFEKPLIEAKKLEDITNQLLGCGASITEINTIRKRLSAVKGGKFAQICSPAKVFSIVLSDILGDPLDMIASGPTTPDLSSCDDARKIVKKYNLKIDYEIEDLLNIETPKELFNVTNQITGSVSQLCSAAASACKLEGYKPIILTDFLECEARQAGIFLSDILKTHRNTKEKLAFIVGGETVVKLTGSGKGGRNQELALASAPAIDAIRGAAIFSVGSDGTDGPTDAAGGYVDYTSLSELSDKNINIYDILQNNDAYYALSAIDGLIITGPTGTNVNDVAVALIG